MILHSHGKATKASEKASITPILWEMEQHWHPSTPNARWALKNLQTCSRFPFPVWYKGRKKSSPANFPLVLLWCADRTRSINKIKWMISHCCVHMDVGAMELWPCVRMTLGVGLTPCHRTADILFPQEPEQHQLWCQRCERLLWADCVWLVWCTWLSGSKNSAWTSVHSEEEEANCSAALLKVAELLV